MKIAKLGVKFFVDVPYSVAPEEYIPVFHRWIRERSVRGVLIDVADYSHVPGGPGVILVAHEGIYSIDAAYGRVGLCFSSRGRESRPGLEGLCEVVATALEACVQLHNEPELSGRVRFRGDEMSLFANDRLLAPNTAETLVAFEMILREWTSIVYPKGGCGWERQDDPRERFSVLIRAAQQVDVAELRARVEGR